MKSGLVKWAIRIFSRRAVTQNEAASSQELVEGSASWREREGKFKNRDKREFGEGTTYQGPANREWQDTHGLGATGGRSDRL